MDGIHFFDLFEWLCGPPVPVARGLPNTCFGFHSLIDRVVMKNVILIGASGHLSPGAKNKQQSWYKYTTGTTAKVFGIAKLVYDPTRTTVILT